MNVQIAAAVASSELPTDARSAARQRADKKIMRFLDPLAAPAFLAAALTVDRAGGIADPERCAIFTVSRRDPDYAQPELPEQWARGAEGVATYYQSLSVPTDWLRTMTNNVLCHVAVAHRLRGPNMHLTGDVAALLAVIGLAGDALAHQEVSAALVVCFDVANGDDHGVTVHGHAAAVLLTGDDGAAPVELLAAALPSPGTRPTDALDQLIAHWRSADPPLAEMPRAS